MAKSKTTFFCQSCGTESPKWVGKCPGCNEWNTFVGELVQKTTASSPAPIFNQKSNQKNIV